MALPLSFDSQALALDAQPQIGSESEFTTFASSFSISPRHSSEDASDPVYSDSEDEHEALSPSASPYSSPFLDNIRAVNDNEIDLAGTAVHPELSFQFGFGSAVESAAAFSGHDTVRSNRKRSPFFTAESAGLRLRDEFAGCPQPSPVLLQRLDSDLALRPTPLTITNRDATADKPDEDVSMKASAPAPSAVLAAAPALTRVPEPVQAAQASASPAVEKKETEATPSAPLPTSRSRPGRSPSRRVTRTSARRLQAKQDDDDVISIGEYTKAERRAKIARFMEKRKRRKWTHGLMLKCRQVFATNRPRVNGRFVKLPKAICPLIAKGVDMRGFDLSRPVPAAVAQ